MKRSTINLNLGDSLEAMKMMEDNAYDLAIVDPPYNVGASNGNFGGQKKKPSKISGKTKAKHYANHDRTPDEEYFNELFRVSKNQIIWGSNYYPQYLTHSGAIVWDKLTTGPLSDCELAFQSFNKLVYKFTNAWSGFNKGGDTSQRVHPNQKPIRLYEWQIKTFAKEGDKILDTHGGSMSIALACHNLKFDLDLWELDEDYHAAGVKRFNQHIKQLQLF